MESLTAIHRIDETVHGRVRLGVLAYLSTSGCADFTTLVEATGSTKGNLSSHLSKLEEAGYVDIAKAFVGKKTRTTICLTPSGEKAFSDYLGVLKSIVEHFPSRV